MLRRSLGTRAARIYLDASDKTNRGGQMLTEQPTCKNLDELSIIGLTGWGCTEARAVSVPEIQNLIINLCPAVKPTSGQAGPWRKICISNVLGR